MTLLPEPGFALRDHPLPVEPRTAAAFTRSAFWPLHVDTIRRSRSSARRRAHGGSGELVLDTLHPATRCGAGAGSIPADRRPGRAGLSLGGEARTGAKDL